MLNRLVTNSSFFPFVFSTYILRVGKYQTKFLPNHTKSDVFYTYIKRSVLLGKGKLMQNVNFSFAGEHLHPVAPRFWRHWRLGKKDKYFDFDLTFLLQILGIFRIILIF